MSNGQCSTDGCSNPAYARALCCAHYKRQLKQRPASAIRQRSTAPETGALARVPEFTSVADLLAELAAAMPNLPGARCVGSHEIFDAAVAAESQTSDGYANRDYARRVAFELCASCPALDACCTWVRGLPITQRPHGITGGRLHPHEKNTMTTSDGSGDA